MWVPVHKMFGAVRYQYFCVKFRRLPVSYQKYRYRKLQKNGYRIGSEKNPVLYQVPNAHP
ncbi:hypothetical protein HanXRQr2_Chr16g0741761 [Helianthus annuus]|uniref:Uncharacterized protein n=1 Tax=Helianthus annuus TaxID=4232 RepID=A0A9K3GXC7_HELAN|nr:hypothetical protein HanXRQr2_Chr16g0741761 [Helianthus annuus]